MGRGVSAESGVHARALEQEIPWLRSLARRLTTEDADDLVQETWIRARDKPPQERSGLRPWLSSILRNNHRMARRSARARTRRESAQSSPEVLSVETLVAAREIYALLDDLLEELDDADRHLIRERYAADRSAVEIAQELGVPAATVRTRLRRALTRLRSQLDERCGGRRAWAVVASGSGLPQLGVVIVMKAMFGVSLVAAVVAGALWMSGGEDSPQHAEGRPGPVAAASASGHAKAASQAGAKPKPWEADPTWERRVRQREALRGRVREALKLDQPQQEQVERDEVPAVTMGVRVREAVAGCGELLTEDATGRVSLEFHYLGAPGVGAVVDTVTVEVDDIADAEFTECLVASAPMAELGDSGGAIEGTFKGHYTAGVAPNNLLLFLHANPEVADEYEAFSELLTRGDEGVDDALATGLAGTIANDPELAKQFEQWVIEDGLELGPIR